MAQIRGGGALGGPAPVVVERGFSMIWASMGTEPTDSNNWNLPADSPFHFLFVSRDKFAGRMRLLTDAGQEERACPAEILAGAIAWTPLY